MKVIKIKKEELDFLIIQCQNSILDSYLKNGFWDSKSASVILTMSNTDIEKFEEQLFIILTEKGIDDNGEINNFGKTIDNLIGKFNHYED